MNYSIYMKPRIGKIHRDRQQIGSLPRAGGRGKWGVTASGYKMSFWSHKNVLKLDKRWLLYNTAIVLNTTVHLKTANLTLCEFHLMHAHTQACACSLSTNGHNLRNPPWTAGEGDWLIFFPHFF